jgi:5-methylcytosine-specific restriction enzyme A
MQRHLKLIHDLVKGKPAHLRSPEWRRVEKQHLAKEPECQWCGAKVKVQVHHIAPFHLAPGLELEPRNLITLCEEGGDLNCHFIHGHNKDWHSFNDRIREDCDGHHNPITGA